MWLKQSCLPPMTGNVLYIAPIYLWWFWEWFMALFYLYIAKLDVNHQAWGLILDFWFHDGGAFCAAFFSRTTEGARFLGLCNWICLVRNSKYRLWQHSAADIFLGIRFQVASAKWLSGSKLAFGFGSICGNKDFSGFSAMAGWRHKLLVLVAATEAVQWESLREWSFTKVCHCLMVNRSGFNDVTRVSIHQHSYLYYIHLYHIYTICTRSRLDMI